MTVHIVTEASPKVLIVDDDMAVRILLRETLERSGLHVDEAEDGVQALAILERTKPDIVLADIEMPNMDGLEFCSALRSRLDTKDIPVLVVTGNNDVESIENAYEVGATDFISKPINWPLVGHRVRYMIRASRAFNDLKESQSKLEMAQRIGHFGHWDWRILENQMYWSEEIFKIFCLNPTKKPATYEAFMALVHVDDRKVVADFLSAAITIRESVDLEYRVVLPDGNERVVNTQARVTYGEDGTAVRMFGTVQDITERKLSEQRQARLGRIVESSHNEIYIIDAETFHFLEVSKSARRNLGYEMAELSVMTPLDLSPAFNENSFSSMIKPLQTGERDEIVFETHQRRKDGSHYPVEVRLQHLRLERPPVFMAISHDISSRKQAEDRIRRLAYYDTLTGLPNRQHFMDHLHEALKYAKQNNTSGALLYVDLDRFKEINDTLGHNVGDEVLRSVAKRLKTQVRTNDSIGRTWLNDPDAGLSRVGGDEFTLLLPEIRKRENAATVARRIVTALAEPLTVGEFEFLVTPSIGIATFPTDGDDVETLVKHADSAMYHAKRSGKNNYQFYSQDLTVSSMKRLNMEQRLRKALDRQELTLVFQPKVNIRTGEIVGAEALARWHNDELGAVPPAEFISLAEDTGLIFPIGEWVHNAAIEQHNTWRSMGYNRLSIAINVSVNQFRQPAFVRLLTNPALNESEDVGNVILELTETAIMEDLTQNIAILNQMKEKGYKLSVDDFGTGYSSLSYLVQLPIDELKIDRSFVRDIHVDEADSTIVKTILAMGQRLNLKVVAEGVETERQLEFLKQHGCDEFQGYLFSKPISGEEFMRLLAQITPSVHPMDLASSS